MAGPDSAKRGPREGLDIEQYSCLFAALVGVGAGMMAVVTLLQILCGERADCICKSRVRWLQHLDPKDSSPATFQIEKVNGKTVARHVPLAPAIAALLHGWLSDGLKGPAGSAWPVPGQNLDDPAAYLFPGLALGGTGPKRNRRVVDKSLTAMGLPRQTLRSGCGAGTRALRQQPPWEGTPI